jgi:hypothetical protein
MTAQTQHDGSYGFYVPQGTSWRIKPRGLADCNNFSFYPQEIYNVQSTVTANFSRYNQLFRILAYPTNYSIIVLQNSGQTANFYYHVQYTDGTSKYEHCSDKSSQSDFAPPGKTISFVAVLDCMISCDIFGYAN